MKMEQFLIFHQGQQNYDLNPKTNIMNKISIALGAFLSIFLISCEGDPGPVGPPGLDGLDGLDGIQGQVVEVDNVNFDWFPDMNNFSALINFGDVTDFEVIESDAVLVYRYVDTVDLDDGTTADIWSQIPQNYFLAEGTLQYVFEHTRVDVEIFIDGNFDLSTLSTEFTDNQSFRIVFVPSEFAQAGKMDVSNLGNVMSALGIGEAQVQKIDLP